ncbi:MAG: helix-turn-helix transcriptional regulator [Alphaproteobacteria bacterium]|nr:helix-turn-helix transcriptional regulator [Alphaproteobacteria bacterium]
MVSDNALSNARLDAVFHALAHPARRAMLKRLAATPQNIGELAQPFDMTFAGASKHVRVLERAGLVKRKVEGREHICAVAPAPLKTATDWLAHYERLWITSLDALDAMLNEQDAAARKRKRKPK